MISAALETKRDADILAGAADSGADSAESVVSQIGTTFPQTPSDAVDTLRGIDLPGVPRGYLDQHLGGESHGLVAGLTRVRQAVLSDISDQVKLASSTPTKSKVRATAIMHAQTQAFADLSAKYRALNAAQMTTLVGFIHGGER
jgi:hypothetical protein